MRTRSFMLAWLLLSACGQSTPPDDGQLSCGVGTRRDHDVCVPIASDAGGRECGPGTSLVGNACVADASDGGGISCGAGTVLLGRSCTLVRDGGSVACGEGTTLVGTTCVAVPSDGGAACGPGTVLVGAACLPAALDGGDIVCGAGTQLLGNVCTPTPSDGGVSCGAGTVLSNHQCIPSGNGAVSCGPGTQLDAGACVVAGAAPSCAPRVAWADGGALPVVTRSSEFLRVSLGATSSTWMVAFNEQGPQTTLIPVRFDGGVGPAVTIPGRIKLDLVGTSARVALTVTHDGGAATEEVVILDSAGAEVARTAWTAGRRLVALGDEFAQLDSPGLRILSPQGQVGALTVLTPGETLVHLDVEPASGSLAAASIKQGVLQFRTFDATTFAQRSHHVPTALQCEACESAPNVMRMFHTAQRFTVTASFTDNVALGGAAAFHYRLDGSPAGATYGLSSSFTNYPVAATQKYVGLRTLAPEIEVLNAELQPVSTMPFANLVFPMPRGLTYHQTSGVFRGYSVASAPEDRAGFAYWYSGQATASTLQAELRLLVLQCP